MIWTRPRSSDDRPPRLVLRFAVITALSLGLGAAAILVFMRHLNTVQAERTAASHAEFLAERVLSEELEPSDFSQAVPPARRAELDSLLERKVLRPGTVLVTLSRPDRLVTYSTDHELIGQRAASGERTSQAVAGIATSDVAKIASDDGSLKVLRSHVPVSVDGRTGVVAIHQDYGPIDKAARAALLPVAGILELVLALLFILLVPLLVRVSRRLTRYLERIQHQASHDELTGLPNRLGFQTAAAEAVEAARSGDSRAVVIHVDLDRFKEINETLGHESGDELLKAVGLRLRELAGEDVVVARLGGDEFALVGPIASTDAAVGFSSALLSGLETPLVVREIPLEIEASMGVAVHPDSASEVDSLLQAADSAMHTAKDGRLGAFLYDGALEDSTSALTLVREFRRALEDDELVLHFQPKIALADEAVVGAEALVRWQHPERGLLQPFAFIPFVEKTGASRALSQHVLDRATRQLRRWADEGFELGVAVNLTMFDLLDDALPQKVSRLLAETGIEPGRLELEITESVIMGDPTRVRDVVVRLKQIGVSLAIDDFGTGYTSLSYLKDLPVDVLKIDRSFVMGMGENENDRTIVRSMIELAHNLGLKVVAEGVEDADALADLAAFGCDVAQGYYVAKPCPAEELWPAIAAFRAKRDATTAAA